MSTRRQNQPTSTPEADQLEDDVKFEVLSGVGIKCEAGQEPKPESKPGRGKRKAEKPAKMTSPGGSESDGAGELTADKRGRGNAWTPAERVLLLDAMLAQKKGAELEAAVPGRTANQCTTTWA